MTRPPDRDPHPPGSGGLSRRTFLKTIGIGAAATGLVHGAPEGASAAATTVLGPDPVPLELTVNGARVTVAVEPRVTLLRALRNH
ncbi:MAG TPA: twin-arginine translocation signal domain-containing protein, partial [Candidatus Methylomirabilis sp.]